MNMAKIFLMAFLAWNALAAAHAQVPTTTFLRCYYYTPSAQYPVQSYYEWGLAGAGAYYKLPGYWRNADAGQNMFYTAVAPQTLAEVCRSTLAVTGRMHDAHLYSAADAKASYDYAIWTNDPRDQGEAVNKVIVFGDSLSDTGNLSSATGWFIPNRDSWAVGHFSNGPIWSETLAKLLHVPVYTWAVGGAYVGGAPRPLATQINSWLLYMGSAENYKPANTQFLLWMGANDIMGNEPAGEAVARLEEGLTRLLEAGARHILVLNLPDISRTPRYQPGGNPPIAAQVREFNRLLDQVLERLRGKYPFPHRILRLDAHALFNDLMDNKEKFGVRNTTEACLRVPDMPSAYSSSWNMRPQCQADRMAWAFWDLVHPTTEVHKHIGTAAYACVMTYPAKKDC